MDDGAGDPALERAARELYLSLRSWPQLVTVGVGLADGAPALFVYVDCPVAMAARQVPDAYRGYPVALRRMSRPQPL